jgi:hypothetical protein
LINKKAHPVFPSILGKGGLEDWGFFVEIVDNFNFATDIL